MWKEFLTFFLLYVIVIGGHATGHWWKRRQERKTRERAEHESLAALDPTATNTPHITPNHHAGAFMIAMCVHPSTLEFVKHYVVHFLIYSGYVIPH